MFTFPSINFPPFFAKCTKFCFPILGKNFFPSSNKRERKKVAGKKSFLCCAFETMKVVSIWKKNTQNKLILFNTLKTMFHALQTSTYFLLTFLVNIFWKLWLQLQSEYQTCSVFKWEKDVQLLNYSSVPQKGYTVKA